MVAGTQHRWLVSGSWHFGPNTPVDRARVPFDVLAGYDNRWDLLVEPATVVPALLPSQFRAFALDTKRAGFPPGHPWADALPGW